MKLLLFLLLWVLCLVLFTSCTHYPVSSKPREKYAIQGLDSLRNYQQKRLENCTVEYYLHNGVVKWVVLRDGKAVLMSNGETIKRWH